MSSRTSALHAILLSCAAIPAIAGQPEAVSRNLDLVYNIDKLGDANIQVTFQYSASQWAEWKENFGNRPDIVLRDMRYTMATSVLEKFSLEKDEVERRAVGKVTARALARYRNSGQFVIDVTKDMKLVSGEGRDWIFTQTSGVNGEIVSQTLRAKLPEGAHNVHYGPGGDFDALSYTLDLPDAKSKAPLQAGVSLAGLGLLLGTASFFVRRRNVVTLLPPEFPPKPPHAEPPTLPPPA